MKKENLYQEAQEIKNYYEKNKTMPKTCKINNTVYSIYTTSYLLSDLINSNFTTKDYKTIDVRIYNTTDHKDSINEKVQKTDYLQMVKKFIQYCKENKRVPAYITTIQSKKKVSYELFVYCISKIIVYYYNHHTLPNYCIFDKADLQSASSNTKNNANNKSQSTSNCTNPINTKQGCDAMGQNNSYSCGVSALQKCLYKLGIKNVTQKQLAQVCGTTTAGTSHNGIRTGVAWASKKYNVKLSVTEHYFTDYTLKELQQILCNPNKAIICHNNYRNKYGHYESWKSINTNTNTIQVINSLGNKCNYGCYCGYIENRTYTTQKQYCNGIKGQKSLIIITKN